jgi:hypothetical protein
MCLYIRIGYRHEGVVFFVPMFLFGTVVVQISMAEDIDPR